MSQSKKIPRTCGECDFLTYSETEKSLVCTLDVISLHVDKDSRYALCPLLNKLELLLSKEKVLLINDLEKLPPAEPKRGRWIQDRSGAYCCSECMEPCAGYVMMKPRDKFCKMCGSRNEVTE